MGKSTAFAAGLFCFRTSNMEVQFYRKRRRGRGRGVWGGGWGGGGGGGSRSGMGWPPELVPLFVN